MRLHEVPLPESLLSGQCAITVSKGQAWDEMLIAAYDSGWLVLELDEHEIPRKAFQKPEDPE